MLPTTASAHDLAATDDQPDGLILHACHEIFPFAEVDYAAADALVPDGYRVGKVDGKSTVDPTDDTAVVFILVRRCKELNVRGTRVDDPVDSYIAVGIDEPGSTVCDDPLNAQSCTTAPGTPAPHPSFITLGEHDNSRDPGFARLEFYLVQWVTNNKPHALWLKQATGLADSKVKIVRDLAFSYNPRPGFVPGAVDPFFSFAAPFPAPSPFHVGARVTEPGSGPWDSGNNLWAETDNGTLIIFAEHHKGADQFLAPAEGNGKDGAATTSDDRRSPLGKTFAADCRPECEGYTETTRPIWADNAPFASAAWANGQYTKCLRTASNPCGSHLPETTVLP